MKAISIILLISLAVCDQSRFLAQIQTPFFELVRGIASAAGVESKLPDLLKCDPVNADTIKLAQNILEALGGLKASKNPLEAIHQIITDFRKIHDKVLEGFIYCHQVFTKFVPIVDKAIKFAQENQYKIIANFIQNVSLIEENTPAVKEFIKDGNYFGVGYKLGKLYLLLTSKN